MYDRHWLCLTLHLLDLEVPGTHVLLTIVLICYVRGSDVLYSTVTVRLARAEPRSVLRAKR